jgi:hypothetical protein
MTRYFTKLFSMDQHGAFIAKAAAWTYEKESGLFTGTTKEVAALQERLREERGRAPSFGYFGPDQPTLFDTELTINANNLATANRAFNLYLASLAVCDAGIQMCPEVFDIELTDVRSSRDNFFMSRYGLLRPCALACRASRNRSLAYAVHKLHLSYRCVSPAIIDLDPHHGGPQRFRVETDPIFHVYIANAITLAYSAIEEVQCEVKASAKQPSRMPGGSWNPRVKADLEQRLQRSGVNISEPITWALRGPKTRIERSKKIIGSGKPSWSRGNVRDVEVPIIDAIALASWLRSKVTTHKFSKATRSLTAYDAHNVQSLARRIIMEQGRVWDDIPSD